MDELVEVTTFQVDATLLGPKEEWLEKELKRCCEQHGARVRNPVLLPRKASFYVKALSRKG